MSKDTILQDVTQLEDPIYEALIEHEISTENGNKFPLDIFPSAIQSFIDSAVDNLNHTPDYMGASVLSAISTIIGNTVKLYIKESWIEKCNIFMNIIGRPGDGKTHAMSLAYRPIEKKQRVYSEEFQTQAALYKKDQGKGDNSEGLEKPREKKKIIQDFTIEALMLLHSFNKKGITIKIDEAIGFFKNIGRYNSSGELEQYLSLWSGQSVSVNRKTSDPISIYDTCVSFFGTIQPKILPQLTKDDKASNGFIDRILWVYPDKFKKQYWNDQDIPKQEQRNYDSFCDVLFNWSDTSEEPQLLYLSEEAKEYLYQWQNHNTDMQDALTDTEVSINKKLEQYVFRLCIILQMAQAAVKGTLPTEIELNTVKSSIRLYDYFKINALKVRDVIDRIANPLEGLTKLDKMLYLKLYKSSTKNQIQKGVAADAALVFYSENDSPMERDAVNKKLDRFFKKENQLFKKVKHGVYECLIDPEND